MTAFRRKHKRPGQPTKFSERAVQIVLHMAEEINAQNFPKYCSIYHIAVALGVHIDTVYEWQKHHPEFSDAIKKWEAKRNSVAFEFKGWSDARWIFCMKNWTGMTDKQAIDIPQEFTIKIQRIITNQKPEE